MYVYLLSVASLLPLLIRLRVVSYFSLQSYCARNSSMRAQSRDKRGRKPEKKKITYATTAVSGFGKRKRHLCTGIDNSFLLSFISSLTTTMSATWDVKWPNYYLLLLLQVIPVNVNYSYFTLYKASSLNLTIIWSKRGSFYAFLLCRIFIRRSHGSSLSAIVRSDSICFYWNG